MKKLSNTFKKLSNIYMLLGFCAMLTMPGGGEPAHAQTDTGVPANPTKEQVMRVQKEVDSLRFLEFVLDKEIDIKMAKDSLRNTVDTLK